MSELPSFTLTFDPLVLGVPVTLYWGPGNQASYLCYGGFLAEIKNPLSPARIQEPLGTLE